MQGKWQVLKLFLSPEPLESSGVLFIYRSSNSLYYSLKNQIETLDCFLRFPPFPFPFTSFPVPFSSRFFPFSSLPFFAQRDEEVRGSISSQRPKRWSVSRDGGAKRRLSVGAEERGLDMVGEGDGDIGEWYREKINWLRQSAITRKITE